MRTESAATAAITCARSPNAPRCERSSHQGVENRAASHSRLERKKGGFWSAQFCTEVARPKRFELLTPRFVVWCSIQLSYGRVLRIAREVFPNEQIRRERAFSYRLQPPLASLPALVRFERDGNAPVTRGRDPRVHRASQNAFCEDDGLHRNSGLPELRRIMRRKSGKPDLRCQVRQ
jgi:hypothetical protein